MSNCRVFDSFEAVLSLEMTQRLLIGCSLSYPMETRQKTHIETHAGQSSRFSMKLVYENFEALARLKGLWSMP